MQITITDADLAALIQELTVAASKLSYAADKISAVADTANAAIPQLQADVKEAADAAKAVQVNVADALAEIQKDASRIATKVENLSIRNIL
jgi:uncharacterized LabA/DUF88 family protein